MAASNTKGIKKNETLAHTRLNQSSNYYSSRHHKCKIIETESFHQRESQELKFLHFRNATLLQQNIKRIFKESIFYDLKIIYKHKVVYSNQCIIKIRSPWFYSVIKQHFQNKNKIAVYYVRQLRIYSQIKNFIRLLYTNLDIDHYEQYVIQLLLNVSSFNNDYKALSRALTCEKNLSYFMNCCSFENALANNINESNPMSSDMADSGLETGSMVSPQGTISENSSTDLDEPNESSVLKKNYNISDTCGESCSVDDISSRECGGIRNESSEYEYCIQSQTFCESNGVREDGDQTNLYVARSYDYTEPSTVLLCSSNEKNIEDSSLKNGVITQNGKKPNITIEQHLDMNNSSTSRNYYFIDASSLNDDIDVTTTVVGYSNDINGRLSWTNPQIPSSCYIPTTKSNNFLSNDDSFKDANQETMNVQKEYKEITVFEPTFKFSELHESIAGTGKLKKIDTTVAQEELKSYKSANKESLVVEIKEADSGESAQHSPCPDNTKVDNVEKAENKLTGMMSGEEEKLEISSDKQEENEERRPSLIRRNTFELDANDEKLSSLRQEYERRQGNIVFQNSITQYSQHRLDGDPYYDITAESDQKIISKTDAESTSKLPDSLNYERVDKYDLDTTEKENKYIESLSNIKLNDTIHTISRSTSDKLLTNRDDDDISFNSLPVNINEELHINQEKSRLRRNEAAPIISGGACTLDFKKPIESPIAKRKLESTPIVSGGSVITDQFKEKERSKLHMSSLTTAWVVDMSDCQTNSASMKKSKEMRTPMSRSFSPWSSTDKNHEKDKGKSQPSSLGYFVNLDDIGSSNEDPKLEISKHKRRPSDIASEKNYCEFFIDLSDKPKTAASVSMASPIVAKRMPELVRTTMTSSQPNESKKNIFSMFIDLSDPEQASTSRSGVTKSSSSSKLADKRYEFAPRQDSDDRTNAEKKPKSGVFMFIDSDSPIVRRRTLSSSRSAFKRHSWNSDKSGESATGINAETSQEPNKVSPTDQPPPVFRRIHKRAQSLSVDRVGGDFRKFLGAKSSESSHSLNEAAIKKADKSCSEINPQQQKQPDLKQTDDTFEYEIRDTPPNSHVEIVNEDLLLSLKNRNYQELNSITEVQAKPLQQDDCCSEGSETNRTRKSETFDISTSASGPSSSSENPDEKLAELIDSTQENLSLSTAGIEDHKLNKLNNKNPEKISSSTKLNQPANFVRLSDLDKRPLSSSTNSNVFVIKSQEYPVPRLSSSVTETSWVESKLGLSTRINDYRTYIKKVPLTIATGSKSENFDDFGNEGDAEAFISESDLSSLQSSMGRSGQDGSTEETETSTSFAMGKPYNRLGEDLLRMFLEEINPDVTIDVAGRRIRAHKCILSSRCQYFAAMLSGGWIESAGNIISLPGYSYNAVHFALCHIYSGESCIPDSISIVELATLADMLCLEGLKEVIGFTLKVKYCHLFHKPCNGCAVGVLECMPLAAAYGLDEVYRKSLRWITRHFVRIWPTKEFATLPRELMDKCYHQHIVHMSADNVLQTIMDCDKLLTTLPIVRWAEPVFRLVSNLLDASMKYLTDNFTSVLGNESFQALDRELTWNISRLQDHLLAAAERLPPEQACKAYSKLDKMFTISQLDDNQRTKFKWSPLFSELMNKIRSQVEKCLIRDAARAARTNAWLKMGLDLRRRIQEQACLVILPNDAPKRPSRHSNFLKEPKDRPESKQQLNVSRTPPNRNLDLRKVKMVISEQSDKTLKQTPLLQTRKLLINKPKTDPLERKLQSEKLINDTSTIARPKSWPNKMEVKSRYLEPRSRLTVKESILQTNHDKSLCQQRRKIIISSSDSSRTSSPAMRRAAEKKAQSKIIKVPIKKDGKALSSDSLTESNARLSVKKDVSKSCGITRPESPSLKPKDTEAGLSIDSLAEQKKRPLVKKINKMDTSISTDSLMTDITAITTPKSMSTNKSSPILGKTQLHMSINQARNQEKLKKLSPPTQQRNIPPSMRRPARSLEGSTAASRSRAAAIVNTYSTSLSLRKSLLDAAKAPDIPSRILNTAAMTRTSLRQSTLTMRSSFGGLNKVEKKDESITTNQRSNASPVSKRSPKSNVNSRLSKSTIASNKQKVNKIEDKSSNKVKSQTPAADGPKFLNQSSRSGTFLKDEPTILKKSDIETVAIDV